MLLVVLLPSATLPKGVPPTSAPVTQYTLALIRPVDPFPAVLLTLTVMEVLVGWTAVKIAAYPASDPASPGSLSTRLVHVKDPPLAVQVMLSAPPLVSP